MFEPEELMARIVDLEEQLKVSEMAPPAAEQLIDCLEGEIAKRDETIARLEPQLNRAIQANYDLREELAACRVAVENCEVFRARIVELERAGKNDAIAYKAVLERQDELRAELAAIKAKSVMPDVSLAAKALCNRHAMICGVDADDQWKEYSQDFIADAETVLANARLYAAPVQQVSVPDDFVCDSKPLQELLNATAMLLETPCQDSATYWAAQLANVEQLLASPAAPAADAGIVDMYRHLQKVTPYRFKKIQDASITDGGDVMYFHKDRFDAALLADMAAHCAAKGVV